MIETRTSGGIFLLSLMYCSNCETTVRASASVSCCVAGALANGFGKRLEERLVVGKSLNASALPALDEHLNCAVRQLEQLEHRTDGTNRINIRGGGIVLGSVLLGD